MPAVPAQGERTVCEINRVFLTCKDDSDAVAQEQYSKILGKSFPAVPFKATAVSVADDAICENVPSLEDESDAAAARTAEIGALEEQLEDSLGKSFIDSVKSFFSSKIGDDSATKKKCENLQSMSWHRHKLYLAFIANPEHVLVVDYEEDSGLRNPYLLSSDTQQYVQAIEWRPNAGATLAVACKGGAAIWTSSYSGNSGIIERSGAISFVGSPTRAAGLRWVLADFLRCQNNECVTTLSWCPSGRLLATGSIQDASFTIWDVSVGEGAPLRRGLAGTHLLKWSPSGDYLLSAKLDSSFQLWETSTWSSEPWSSASGAIMSAMWNPDGRMVVCAFEKSTTLGTLHFAGKPPSLEVHLLPLELPEIESISKGGCIEKMAWDGSGERLAVSYSGGGRDDDEVYSGLVGIYDTKRSPIVSVCLLGFIRGPGIRAKPLAFSFYHKLTKGALLAVCWSTGFCCVYPLLFKTH